MGGQLDQALTSYIDRQIESGGGKHIKCLGSIQILTCRTFLMQREDIPTQLRTVRLNPSPGLDPDRTWNSGVLKGTLDLTQGTVYNHTVKTSITFSSDKT